MGSSLRGLTGIMGSLGTPPSARKSAANPACEPLEGRQLLAGDMGLGMGLPGLMAPGGPADISGIGGGFGHSNNWGHPGGAGQGAAGSSRATSPVAAASSPAPQGGAGQVIAGTTGSGFPGAGGADSSGDLGGPGGFGGQSAGFREESGFGGGGRGPMLPDQWDGSGSGSTVGDAQLKADSEKLRADMQAVHDKSQVTPALLAKVRDNLKAVMGAESTAADATALATLKADSTTAWTNAGGPTDAQLARVQADRDAVYKSQGVSDALVAQLDASKQAVQAASNVTAADKATLAADRAAVKADLDELEATAPVATPMTTTTPVTSQSDPSDDPPLPGSSAPMAGATPIAATAGATPPVVAAPPVVTPTPAVAATSALAATATVAPPAVAAAPPVAMAPPIAPAVAASTPAVPAAPTPFTPAPAGFAHGLHGWHAWHAAAHGPTPGMPGGFRGGLGRTLRGRRV